MKTRLLKKVRKRYVIKYFPQQITLFDETYLCDCMVLLDREERYSISGVEIGTPENHKNIFSNNALTKEQAKAILLDKLAKWIAKDYKHTRSRKSKQVVETVWYNRK